MKRKRVSNLLCRIAVIEISSLELLENFTPYPHDPGNLSAKD